MEQIVIVAYRADELNTKVKQHIEKGYVPIGGHRVVTFHDQLRYAGNQHKDTVRSSEYSQTMRLENKPSEKSYFLLKEVFGNITNHPEEYGVVEHHFNKWEDTYAKVRKVIADNLGGTEDKVSLLFEGSINECNESLSAIIETPSRTITKEFCLIDVSYYE